MSRPTNRAELERLRDRHRADEAYWLDRARRADQAGHRDSANAMRGGAEYQRRRAEQIEAQLAALDSAGTESAS